MNCPHCNNLIDESYHYCPKCGYNLKVFLPMTMHYLKQDKSF